MSLKPAKYLILFSLLTAGFIAVWTNFDKIILFKDNLEIVASEDNNKKIILDYNKNLEQDKSQVINQENTPVEMEPEKYKINNLSYDAQATNKKYTEYLQYLRLLNDIEENILLKNYSAASIKLKEIKHYSFSQYFKAELEALEKDIENNAQTTVYNVFPGDSRAFKWLAKLFSIKYKPTEAQEQRALIISNFSNLKSKIYSAEKIDEIMKDR